MILRKQFEKETGINIYYQDNEKNNYKRLWSYIKWLEKRVDKYTKDNKD